MKKTKNITHRRKTFSLLDIFGTLPVNPVDFAKGLPYPIKWTGKCLEGKSWCVNCGTLTPKIPRSHHDKCISFKEKDSYETFANPLGGCPTCGEDELRVDSCRELEISEIICPDCGWHLTGNESEDTLVVKFGKIYERDVSLWV